MIYTITKTWAFHSAHRLTGAYQGKCANLHGHTWQISVSLSAPELDARAMVYDFNEMKPLGEWIEDVLDHAVILSEQDPLLGVFKKNNLKICTVPENPTSETLCRYVRVKAVELFEHNGVRVSEVAVKESEFSRAVLG